MSRMNRRKFLVNSCKTCTAMATAAAFAKLGLINAYAQNVSDYKAMVCVFLFGGNDSNNLLIPMGTTANDNGYNAYLTGRPASSAINLPLSPQPGNAASILPLTGQNANQSGQPYQTFGVNGSMPEVQALYNSNNLAFVCNAGTLISPTTKTQYTSKQVPLPSNLFSHSDQQNQWQTASSNSFSPSGWGGRMADIFAADNAGVPIPAVISLAGAPVFGSGTQTQQMSIGTGTISPATCSTGNNASTCISNQQTLLTLDSGAALVAQASVITGNAFNYATTLSGVLTGVTTTATFPNTNIGLQFQQVAKIIKEHISNALNLGVKGRQIFFLSLGGFDTHTGQGVFNGAAAPKDVLAKDP